MPMNQANHPYRILAVTALVLSSLAAVSQQPARTHGTLDWWSLQPLAHLTIPQIENQKSKIENPIDAFLLAKLHEKGLDFAPSADHRTLIRRLSFDLIGLPPDPALLDEPYNMAVERLLASPRYGERWGRHWLDVVRFGETDGGEHNYERLNAWPYRDYVIDALNRDLPYNQFIRDQIAGDALYPSDRNKIAATGFLVSGPWDQVSAVLNKDPLMRKTARMDELDDMVTTTCATFLGLTVNCARCHDHKFDPIPSRDYYRMAAAFSGAGFGERAVASAEERKRYDLQVGPLRSELDKVRNELAAIENPVTARLLLVKYRACDEGRRNEPRRIPINPLYNRETFRPVVARYWRMAVTAQAGSSARIDKLELRPAGTAIHAWKAATAASVDKPAVLSMDLGEPKNVSEIAWSSDLSDGERDGTPTLFRFEASTDGSVWQPVASNLDHVSSLELDLPTLPDEELNRTLSEDLRTKRAALAKRRDELQARISVIPTPARIYAVNSHAPEKVAVLDRGSVAKPGEEVTPGGLSAVRELSAQFTIPSDATDAHRRIALADWIADPRNPLTARVIVNRVWYYHFGAGIVNTPSDFGVNGDRPSHPELLDWLAAAFMEHGWSLKWLHRKIVTSQAYRQSSAFNPKAHAIDAGNRLLWRMGLRRMDAETLRDSVLSVAGSLDLTAGGPGFALHKKGARGSFIYHSLDNDGPEVWRRAVYRFVVRGGDRVLLDSFDCPDPSVATPQRTVSNTPVQALALMNNAFVVRQADLLARRLERETPGDTSAQIGRAYLLAFGRPARPAEVAEGARFLKDRSLGLYCRALLNANEFVYVP
jgi:hypothetical protein